MIKSCLKTSLLLCATSIGIGASFASNSEKIESDINDKLLTDKSQDTDWEVSGNFSEIFDSGNDGTLNRYFSVKPKFSESSVKSIDVCRYRDIGTVIFLKLKNENNNLKSDLLKNNLVEINWRFEATYISKDKNRLDEFLTYFVSQKIIPISVQKIIMEKVTTEKPLKENIKINKIENEIEKVNNIGQKKNCGEFSSKEAKNVLQRHVGYTNANNSYPIIGAYGAGPCVIMAVYNPETKSAALCHIDSPTNLSSLQSIFSKLKTKNDHNLEIHLAGGNSSSKEMAHNLLKLIKETQNVEIKSSKLIPGGYKGESLAIDSRTGEIFTNFSYDQLDEGKSFDKRCQLIGLQWDRSPLRVEPGLEFKE